MGCKECGKPKCNGECGCKSPKVLQINNPAEYITFHKVSIPAAMGDSTTNPPAVGKYKNVLLYYEADQTSWLYSSDGIPVKLANGIINYEDVINLPQINGHTLIGDKSSSELGLQGELTAGKNIQINDNVISATDTTYTAGNGLNLNGTEFSVDTTVLATKEDLGDYYTKTETDTKLAPKLEAEVVAELPATGDSSKLYLTPKAHKTQTATGNPITASVTEQAGALESFNLDGDTFQQSYTGKNLLPLNSSSDAGVRGIVNADGSLTIKGTAEASKGLKVFTTTRHFTAGTYTFSISSALSSILNFTIAQNVGFRIPAGETSATTTLEQDYGGGSIFFLASVGTEYDFTIKAQLVSGSTPDYDFEPYVGGQPSPNPDYPQPIQTVTGEQTVTINSTAYPISLGSIELCKLGDYQDYIWKDGNDWKVHKDIKKSVFDQNSGWTKNQYGTNAYNVKAEDIFTAVAEIGVISPQFTAKSYNGRTDAVNNIIFADSNSGMATSERGITIRNTDWSDLTIFTTWITSNPVTTYYVLATPADTVITDQTLITQLEAIRTASLQNGANTITNTATGSNLAGDMEIGYYSYNPRNRYDKWLWLDIDNEYEQIGR